MKRIIPCPFPLRDDVRGGMEPCAEPITVDITFHLPSGRPDTEDGGFFSLDDYEPCHHGHALSDDQLTDICDTLNRELL